MSAAARPAAYVPNPSIVRRRVTGGVLELLPQGDSYWIVPPTFGQPWPQMGGLFVGGMESPDDDPFKAYWLVASWASRVLPWYVAMEWASTLQVSGHKGWTLPSRAEMRTMYTNVKHLFKPVVHWTRTQLAHDADEAYAFDFKDGHCDSYYNTSSSRLARAVRRIPMRIENDE
ncbi:MAG: hypothetical protein JWL65_5381 [Gammaproteobacteria bacterium]|nr:hypothetical protein [Gammaproteobacteria bacterium]